MDTRSISLLVVDDDELVALNIKSAFRDSDVVGSIDVARSGEEGLKLLRSGAVSTSRLVVLLDLDMPGMSGLEFLSQLRAEQALASLPVVILSTSNEPRDRDRAYQLGVAGYLVKPLSRRHFLDTMHALESYFSRVEFPSDVQYCSMAEGWRILVVDGDLGRRGKASSARAPRSG